MRARIMRLVISLLGLALVSCVTRGEIEELKANQEKILAKLDDVSKARPSARPPRRAPDPNKVYAFPVGEASIKGNKDALVTIIEVSDFQCPYCSRVNTTLKQVAEKYGNDVRVVFKHNPLPFHKRGMPAANAAECAAEQGKFWEMHDKMFANQRALEDADLEKYAGEIGLNASRWKECQTSLKYKKRIQGDQRTSQSLGARGTPAFFINGRFLSGAQPLPKFQAVIDDVLKKAKASGVSAGKYYAQEIVAKGSKTM